MKIEPKLTETAVLTELGVRLATVRLEQQLSQAELAEQAGLSKRTVERIEAGRSTQLSSLIRVLRVLNLLAGLDQLVPEGAPSPMDLLKLRGKQRKRASPARKKGASRRPWRWGEER